MRFGSKRRVDGTGRSRSSRERRQDAMDMVAQILALAQTTADQAITDAHAEAARIIADAQAKADQIVGSAQSKAALDRDRSAEPF